MAKQAAQLHIAKAAIVALVLYGIFAEHRRNNVQQRMLEDRHPWMVEVTDEVLTLSNNAITEDDERETWDQFLKSNPSLRKPYDFAPFRENTDKLRAIRIPE